MLEILPICAVFTLCDGSGGGSGDNVGGGGNAWDSHAPQRPAF